MIHVKMKIEYVQLPVFLKADVFEFPDMAQFDNHLMNVGQIFNERMENCV